MTFEGSSSDAPAGCSPFVRAASRPAEGVARAAAALGPHPVEQRTAEPDGCGNHFWERATEASVKRRARMTQSPGKRPLWRPGPPTAGCGRAVGRFCFLYERLFVSSENDGMGSESAPNRVRGGAPFLSRASLTLLFISPVAEL